MGVNCTDKNFRKTCVYARVMFTPGDDDDEEAGYQWRCNYSLITGHLRKCPIEDCTKYRRKKAAKEDDTH